VVDASFTVLAGQRPHPRPRSAVHVPDADDVGAA